MAVRNMQTGYVGIMNSDGIIILENHGLIKKFKLDELLPHSFGACDIKTE